MKVVVPMAGRGSRFSNEGYATPKPLIEVAGKPMIFWALKSIEHLEPSAVIFILLKEHEEAFKASDLLRSGTNLPIQFCFIDEVTEGQLCTVLAAKASINTEEDVLIISSDTWVENNLADEISTTSAEGLISVFNLPGEQWSFARVNEYEDVVEVAEKVRISEWASTGLYYFRHGNQLVKFGEELIVQKEKTRGEYYVIPVYQKMINAGLKVGISKATAMWDMGTPLAKEQFESYWEKNG